VHRATFVWAGDNEENEILAALRQLRHDYELLLQENRSMEEFCEEVRAYSQNPQAPPHRRTAARLLPCTRLVVHFLLPTLLLPHVPFITTAAAATLRFISRPPCTLA